MTLEALLELKSELKRFESRLEHCIEDEVEEKRRKEKGLKYPHTQTSFKHNRIAALKRSGLDLKFKITETLK